MTAAPDMKLQLISCLNTKTYPSTHNKNISTLLMTLIVYVVGNNNVTTGMSKYLDCYKGFFGNTL